ncbi:InlB B-repeat-containing protein [Candidatus Saccharibacteria bacterium]|nr:InlB B-repeat-containing protein [Candidatus Saccharibacteria bacterium]
MSNISIIQKIKKNFLINHKSVAYILTAFTLIAIQIFGAFHTIAAYAAESYDIFVSAPTPPQGPNAETSSQLKNGTITISPSEEPNNPIASSSVIAGQPITITASPNRGYELSSLNASTSAIPEGPGRKITRSGIGTININDTTPIFLTLNGLNFTSGEWSSALVIKVNSTITSEVYVDVQGNNKTIGGNHGGIKFQGPVGATANVHFWSSTGGQLEVGAQNSTGNKKYAYYQAERGIAVNYDVLPASTVSNMKVRSTNYNDFSSFINDARNASGRGSAIFNISKAAEPTPFSLNKVSDNQYTATMPSSNLNISADFTKRTTDTINFSDDKFEVEILNADKLADGSETIPQYNLWYDDILLDNNEFNLTRTNNDLSAQKVTFTFTLKDNSAYHLSTGSEDSISTEVSMPIRSINILNPETGETINQIIVSAGESITIPAPESKPGYNFTGWQNGEDFYPENQPITITDNISLTPIYEARTDTPYTIEHYREAEDHNGYTMLRETRTGTTDATAENLTKTIEGWTFDPTNPKNITSGKIAGDGSLTLKYHYSINNHTAVFYDYDGTELTAKDTASALDTLPEAPIHDGYTFTNWHNSDGAIAELPYTTFEPTALYAAYDYNITVNGTPYRVNTTTTLAQLKEAVATALGVDPSDPRITTGNGVVPTDNDSTLISLGIIAGTETYASSNEAIFNAIVDFEDRFNSDPKNTDSWSDLRDLLFEVYDYINENRPNLSTYEIDRLNSLAGKIGDLYFTINDISNEIGNIQIAISGLYPEDWDFDESHVADAVTSNNRDQINNLATRAQSVLTDSAAYLTDGDKENLEEILTHTSAMLDRLNTIDTAITEARDINSIPLEDLTLDDKDSLNTKFTTLSDLHQNHSANFTETQLSEASEILESLNNKLQKLAEIDALIGAKGEISLNPNSAENYGLAAITNTPEELKTIIPFTNSEKMSIMDGANATVTLKVTDISNTITNSEQNLIKNELGSAEEIALYLNAHLYKNVDGYQFTEIHELANPTTITFKLPSEILAKLTDTTKAYMIRNHNGETTKIPLTISGDTASFETDRFSTYAIAHPVPSLGLPNTGTLTKIITTASSSLIFSALIAIIISVIAFLIRRN